MILIKTDEIIRLIEAIKGTDFSEFNLESEGFRLSLSRGKTGETLSQLPPKKQMEPQIEVKKEEPQELSQATDKNLVEVIAPMVGTFYRAPSPEEEPFVTVGDKVKPEDTLCILEAMKLMNEIKAEQAGELMEILVENGEMVEYGQPLFRIKVGT